MKRSVIAILILTAGVWKVAAQAPNRAAIAGSKEDEAAVERGGALFGAQCGACHGTSARGTATGPDLIRSVLVRDDEQGEIILPVLRDGRQEKGMPRPGLTEAQMGDVVAWLHTLIYGAANRGTYEFLDILVGDAAKGEQYFNGAGKCNTCHAPKGDLAGIGRKYDPPVLQSLWLNPRRTRGGASRAARTVTVTPASGASISGTLESLDEFNVALRDSSGAYHSLPILNNVPRVEIHDPLQPHFDLYRVLTDVDIHNVTAYLATLQ